MTLVIKQGTIVNPGDNVFRVADILIENGKIKTIGQNLKGDQYLDARGKFVMPGFIDGHVHLREPGYEYKEDIMSGTMAAALGGYTSVVAMANTNPVVDNVEILEYIKKRSQQAHVNVFQVSAVTKNLEGRELSPVDKMIKAGAVALSDDGKPICDDNIMLEAMKKAKELGVPILSHCEDEKLFDSKGRFPKECEQLMAARDIELAAKNDLAVHLCHISTKGSLELIKNAKKQGVKVTCEAAPHHFILTQDHEDSSKKVNPPLRDNEDIDAIIEGLFNDTIDIIATDHAPHDRESKDGGFDKASFGISSIECSVGLVFEELYHKRSMALDRIAKLMSTNPAKIFGLRDRGQVQEGYIADLTIMDLNKKWTIDISKLETKGKNCPYEGRQVRGKVYSTIVGGKIIMLGGEILDDNR